MNTWTLCVALTLVAVSGCSSEQSSTDARPVAPPVAGPAGQPGVASISVEAARQAGVETSLADEAMLRETLTLYGNIQADADRVRAVTARFPGVVRSVSRQVGDRVAMGQTLATVESNESLQTYAVTSPIAGVVTQRRTNPGEVAGTEALFEVADFSKVRAELSVFPKERHRLTVGQSATVRGTEGPGAVGLISYVAPLGSAQTQSILTRIVLSNPDATWTPGQFVTAEVTTRETRARVTVVPAAIQQIKGHAVVFVQTATGFEAREVALARQGRDLIEVSDGLAAGERYVSRNSYLVKAELLKNEAGED